MPACPTCGQDNPERARFCWSCGAAIAEAPRSGAEERKIVSVLFVDLVGFTAASEKADPEDVRARLRPYHARVKQEIERFGGTVEKFVGDAVMAVFGAPVSHEDDAERAINAALAMQASMAGLNADLARRYGVRLSLRIGVNTGEVVAGMLGGDVQAAYTVVGDAVNTAQRIESIAPPDEVVVSATTRRLAVRSFEFEEMPAVQLKGKVEAIRPYRVIRRRYEEIAPDATPFVGREVELALLRNALVDAVVSHGRIIEVTGEAGVGKSRLVGELRAGLATNIDRLVIRCASFETNTPYAAIADLFRASFQLHATDDEATARRAIAGGTAALGGPLDEMVAELILEILGYNASLRVDPETRRRMIVRVMRSLLRAEADHATLVLVVEDLQWMDDASAQVFAEVAADVTRLPVLFVGTARPGWTAPWATETVALAPLGEAQSRQLIEAIFESPVDDAFVATVLGRTGGNPFFVEEVARELRSFGLVVERTGHVTLRPEAHDAVPAT